jgi:hypothetical protein
MSTPTPTLGIQGPVSFFSQGPGEQTPVLEVSTATTGPMVESAGMYAVATVSYEVTSGTQGVAEQGTQSTGQGVSQEQVSFEDHTAATKEAVGLLQTNLASSVNPTVPAASAVGGLAGTGTFAGARTVVVFNMAELSSYELLKYTSGGVDLATTQVARLGGVDSYLDHSVPPLPADPDQRAAEIAQQTLNLMWGNVVKKVPSCTRCAELAWQTVEVFW